MPHTDDSATRHTREPYPQARSGESGNAVPSNSIHEMVASGAPPEGTSPQEVGAINLPDFDGPVVFYTRMGIGVFDPRWWDYRIRLFAATTLPSVSRFCTLGAEWIIFIDEDMDPSTLKSLQDLIHSAGLEKSVTFAPVQFHFDAFAELAAFAGARVKAGQNVGLIRIDDDDALASDFLVRCHSRLVEVEFEPAIITLSAGWEVSLAERKMRPINLEFMSLNTFFYGPISLVQSFAQAGHHRLIDWAPRNGLHVIVDDDPHHSFMYMRHKQSDTSFGARRKAILEDEGCRFLTQASYSSFGIDQQRLGDWRDHAKNAPSTGRNKTWEISATIVEDASRLRKELLSKKIQLRELTSEVFE
jgi:hypothetical protein